MLYNGYMFLSMRPPPPKNPIVAISCCPQEFGHPLSLILASYKSASVSNFNSRNFLWISFASLCEFVNAKLHEVVPEHPTTEDIVRPPGFASPISNNLEYSFGRSSSFTHLNTISCVNPFLVLQYFLSSILQNRQEQKEFLS